MVPHMPATGSKVPVYHWSTFCMLSSSGWTSDTRPFQLRRAPGVGTFIPHGHQVSDDSDGVHKCDHTRGVDTKQLDDGIDHTFVSAGGSETICPSFLFKLCPP